MKKRMIIPTTMLLVALLASGCGFQVVTGSGKIASETRTVSSFSSVTLAGIGDVYLTQGATESVRIEAEDNLIQYFDTSVQGTTLKIGIKDQFIGINMHPTQPIKFYVTFPKIEAITLAGSGNFLAGTLQASAFKIDLLGSGNITTDSLTATHLEISLAGSGNIKLGKLSASEVNVGIAGAGNVQIDGLTADKISTRTAGSGNITLGGKVSEQTVEILGSGDYRANGLTSTNANVRVTGSGSSQVSASGSLTVNILGSGDVAYSGSPKTNVSIAGSGKVTQAGK